jgi:hypothetical protein
VLVPGGLYLTSSHPGVPGVPISGMSVTVCDTVARFKNLGLHKQIFIFDLPQLVRVLNASDIAQFSYVNSVPQHECAGSSS